MPNDFGLKQPTLPTTPENHSSWPSWYYGPNDGEAQICNGPDDVPDGWATSPGNAKAEARRRVKEHRDQAGGKGTKADTKDFMPRANIIAELKQRGIKYEYDTASDATLWTLLRDLREHEGARPDSERE